MFVNSNFIPTILSRLSILLISYISRDLDNTKILLYKLFVRYLVVKPECVNAAKIKITKLKFEFLNLTFTVNKEQVDIDENFIVSRNFITSNMFF